MSLVFNMVGGGGAATAGGITNFPTIEEVRTNWTAVNLVTHPTNDIIPVASSIILAFIIGIKEETDRGIFFLEVKQNQDFAFENLCNEDGAIHAFELYLERDAMSYAIVLPDVLVGEAIPDETIQSVIYYTTADNFFSK